MVAISSAPVSIPFETLTLYYTIDSNLSDALVLVFIGAAQTIGASTQLSSRVQSHIVSPAGLRSFSRLAISPSSPLYNAVTCLSQQDQGDEVCRTLAYSVMKYFAELSESTKQEWTRQSRSGGRHIDESNLFSDAHAAALAGRMQKLPNGPAIAKQLWPLFDAQLSATADVDLVLPNNVLTQLQTLPADTRLLSSPQNDYSALVGFFGEPGFIPSEKVRRAPSRPLQTSRGHSFRREQKEALRRELCELLDTEESFVVKLDQLVHEHAVAVVGNNLPKDSSSQATEAAALRTLFPESLDRILAVNTGFFHQLLKVVEDTEADAIADLEQDSGFVVEEVAKRDPTGATEVARCFLDWLPQFRDCYSSYIQAHSEFSSVLKNLISGEASSAVAMKIQEIGEQRLLSMLIEPVQRLPRYSLYLDNLILQLPRRHPALSLFLQAKDLIADVCAQEGPSGRRQKAVNVLKRLVASWPSDFSPSSRLITAVDLRETGRCLDSSANYIGLLFATHFVLVAKKHAECLTARGVLAETASADANLESTRHSDMTHPLAFEDSASLGSINAVGLSQGTILQLVPNSRPHATLGTTLDTTIRTFILDGPYAERAERFVREFALARVEGRFSEGVRDGNGWEVREIEGSTAGLSLVTAICDEHVSSSGRIGAPTVELVIDPSQTTFQQQQSNAGPRISGTITCEGNGFFRIEVGSANAQKTRDLVTLAEFMPVLIKRLSALVQFNHSLRSSTTACYFIEHYASCLCSLPLPRPADAFTENRPKRPRSHSPVKALTSLFGGSAKEGGGYRKIPPLGESLEPVPAMRPQLGPKLKPDPNLASRMNDSAPKVVMVGSGNPSGPSSVQGLEQCLANYLLALRARKGNVIGRVISSRHTADMAVVGRLNMAVMQQPENNELAANEAVDVLFAAFENFLKNSWNPRLGPVLDITFLNDLQSRSPVLSPLDYEEYLETRLADLGPQNQRAFKAILATFVDLLDGMSSDGDRGALMATFTDMLVGEGRPHEYIPLFDRFVEDSDIILNDGSLSNNNTPYQGSWASSAATPSTHTGSLGSKASSLGRRLGIHSTTDNAKANESILGSVFRSMSKASRNEDGSLRERSAPRQPVSAEASAKSTPRSRPSSHGRVLAQGLDQSNSRPTTGHSWNEIERSELVVASGGQRSGSTRKKKRRSSLSDLESLPLPNTSPFWDSGTPSRRTAQEASPLAPRGLMSVRATRESISAQKSHTHVQGNQAKVLRRGATVNHSGVEPGPRPLSTPPARAKTERYRSQNSPAKKENIPPATPERPFNHVTPHLGHTRGILSERPGSGNTPPPGVNVADSMRELSPSKVRTASEAPQIDAAGNASPWILLEQARAQGGSILEAEEGLQTELAKIGEELAALNASPSPSKPRLNALDAMTEGIPTPRKTSATLQNISGRLKALEAKLPHLISNLTRRVEALQQDIERALLASSGGSQYGTDGLKQRQPASSNNGTMSERHAAVRAPLSQQPSSEPIEGELARQLRESNEQAERWRAECDQLRRENGALRARLGET